MPEERVGTVLCTRPRSKFRDIIEGLEYVRKQGGFRFPIPMAGIMAEPKFPDKYKAIMPEVK
jgi:hypothetical protein